MELVTPGLGLIFWMTLSFGLVLIVLRKYAWHPILASIRSRERVIAKSLINARRIEKEALELQQIRLEKMQETEMLIQGMLKIAAEESEQLLAAARKTAFAESRRIIEDAAKTIDAQKKNALKEIKGEVARLSLDMAEKVLQEEFSDKAKNTRYVQQLLDNMMLN
jgi:F-type H+-transporting ATPase subunit b